MNSFKPDQKILAEQEEQGYSFLYNVSPHVEAQYREKTGADGRVNLVPVALDSSLSSFEIIARHAPKIGVQSDRLRVVMDAYRNLDFDLAALFVRTDDLEGILKRNPIYKVL